MSSSEFETFGPLGRDVVKYFKSHFKPLKLDNVKESKLDLTPIKIPYLGKCS